MNAENPQIEVLDVLATCEKALRSKTSDADAIAAVLDTIQSKIQSWTEGQPDMMELLCHFVKEQAAEIAETKSASIIDVLVQTNILNNWETNSAANHLKKIEKALLNYSPRDSLLILYLQILQRGSLRQNYSPEQDALLRTGLARLEADQLKLGNAIYAKIFNERWIEEQLPGLTKPIVVIQSKPGLVKTAREALSVGKQQPLRISNRIVKGLLLASGLAVLMTLTVTQFQKVSQEPGQQPGQETAEQNPFNPAATAVAIESPDSTANAPLPGKLTEITLLGDNFSGYSTFRNADFQSVLKEVGIAIDYADEFDQTLRAQKLSEGEADLIVTTLDQVLQQQPKGKIVALLDHTVGADAVVLNTKQYSSLASLLDLQKLVQQARSQGKKLSIAYASDTPSEYLALVLDIKFDTFNLSDFELKPVADASEAWALMQDPNENVAIAVLWDPYVAKARQQGYKVVLSSQDTPNEIVDVLVASDQLIESNPALISNLLEKYYRRIDANTRDATQLQAQVAEDGNLSSADATTIISGIDFFTATEARNWLKDGTLEKRLGATAALLTLSDRLKAVPASLPSLYTDQFVTEAADNTQALIDLVKADNPQLAEKLAGSRPLVTVASPLSVAQVKQAADIGNFQVRGQVGFATSSAQLTQEGEQTLNQLSDELKEFNAQTIAVRVIGHTSRTGNEQLNQTLSQQRASVVANYLKGKGVILTIVPEGKGSSEPLATIAPADTQNQRTEIRLVRVNESL